MILRSVTVLYLLMSLLIMSVQSRERQDPTISECAARGGECDESRGRPVCGTDDQTYPSRCHLLRVQCSGHQVSLKYRGPCKACKEARDYAVKHKSKSPPKFIPRCKPDGTYAPIQCLGDTGCWCSDITGKPIENTSVRTGKPKCREFTRANIRRSPARHLGPNRARRACTQLDRATFNINLIKVFQSEYIRSGQHQRDIAAGTMGAARTISGGFTAPSDKLTLDWKFSFLDANSNQILDKGEFRELKKLVKRAVKPRRCGRAFGKFCDVNDDDRLSLSEWNNCITKDGINRHPGIDTENNVNSPGDGLGYAHQTTSSSKNGASANDNSNNNKNQNQHDSNNHNNNHNHNNHHLLHSNRHEIHTNHNNNKNNNNNLHIIKNMPHSTLDDLDSESGGASEDDESSQRLDYDDDADYEPEDADDDDGGDDGLNISMINTFGSSTKFPSILFLKPKLESSHKESEGESDCLADQAAALEEQRHGGTIFYVPECTPDGRYQRVQCYRSTPYCWCVHEDSGKNIPGTSVKDRRPQCDSIYPQSRPMKGCPEPRKTEFLKNLKEFLKSQILSNSNLGANTTKWNSDDERIATLSFVLLDKNKNKVWERKEWKTFREFMTNSKTLRKCGKKMPRYCDVNTDKKITLTEWLSCLQTQRIVVETPKTLDPNGSSTIKPPRLKGSNPLEQYLKEE